MVCRGFGPRHPAPVASGSGSPSSRHVTWKTGHAHNDSSTPNDPLSSFLSRTVSVMKARAGVHLLLNLFTLVLKNAGPFPRCFAFVQFKSLFYFPPLSSSCPMWSWNAPWNEKVCGRSSGISFGLNWASKSLIYRHKDALSVKMCHFMQLGWWARCEKIGPNHRFDR